MLPPPPNWFFSVSSFIGFLLCMIPLHWHLEVRNTGTCLYMIWTGLACFVLFINSVVWNSDVIDRAPIWCDISTKLLIGSAVAIPAASLCINRRLYQIASIRTVTKTWAEKRRDVMTDLAIGLGIPLVEMILHVVVQSHRFYIIEEVGCFPFVWNTLLAYPLVYAWPVCIGLVSASYAVRTLRELAIRRAQFKEFLSVNSNMNPSRYLRLMALAATEVLLTVPLGSLIIYINVSSGEHPLPAYVDWAYAHDGFHHIVQVPSVVWRVNEYKLTGYEMTRFLPVFSALVFFALFGFADEAKRNYRLAYTSLAKRVGLSTGSVSATGTPTTTGTNPDLSYKGSSAPIPVHITPHKEKKRDSFASFSSHISLADCGGALADVKGIQFSPMATTTSGSMPRDGSTSIQQDSFPKLSVDLTSVPLPDFSEDSFDMSISPLWIDDVGLAV